jgi:hypothetical protein
MTTALHLPSSVHSLRADALKYFTSASQAKDRLKRIKQENESRVAGIIGTAEVVGAAFAVSWWNGKHGDATGTYKLFGFDSDMLVGGLLVALGVFELGGKYDEDLYRLGAGALASWATRTGYQKGATGRTPTTGTATAATGGVAPAGSYQP